MMRYRRDRRSRALITVFVTVFLCGIEGSAFAQSFSSSNLFAGYSFLGANLSSGEHANLNGWNISAEKKYLPFFGVIADFSGHYGSTELRESCSQSSQTQCPVSASVSEHYFQFGIRGSYAAPRVRPFAELLFGAVRTAENTTLSNSKTSFEATLGAGIDYRLSSRFAWRVGAGWVRGGSFVSQQNSLRASTGLVVHF